MKTSKNIHIPNNVVDVHWLHEQLEAPNLVILDATIPKVVGNENEIPNRWIPQTIFFDIKKSFSKADAPFPNTLPTAQQFQQEARKIGINKDSCVIIYDKEGIYSSPRAWYLFKAFGHDNVAVLSGGLPAWSQMGYPIIDKLQRSNGEGDFESDHRLDHFVDLETIQQLSKGDGCVILDARSSERFTGKVPEPRKGLRSGTIPGSKNLPYTMLLNGTALKTVEEISRLFDGLSSNDDQLIMSCGSGITACTLALGATLTGRKNITVYDGSWTEYGSLIHE